MAEPKTRLDEREAREEVGREGMVDWVLNHRSNIATDLVGRVCGGLERLGVASGWLDWLYAIMLFQ